MEAISNSLHDEFKVFLPVLLPQMLQVLHADPTSNSQARLRILRAFELFGPSLDDYLHLIVPALVRLSCACAFG